MPIGRGRPKVRLLGMLFITILPHTPAVAESLWDHNNSVMRLEANGSSRSFYYVEPRSGLPASSGDLLFSGQKSGNSYSGEARILSSRCGPATYPVSGPVADDQRTVTMYGKAPLRGSDCRVMGYRDDTLVFTLREEKAAADGAIEVEISRRSLGVHIPVALIGSTVHARMAEDEHFVFMLEDALKDLTGDADVLLLEKPGLNNGFATTWTNFDNKEVKIILFDPVELNKLRDKVSDGHLWRLNAISALFTIGHEIGHHLCDHLQDRLGSKPWKELQADRVAGAILSRSQWREYFGNASRDEYESVMRSTLRAEASSTHPGIDDRIAAFREGWDKNRACK